MGQGDAIQTVGDQPLPTGIEVVDISGQFLIPGLMDLHAHVIPKTRFLPQAKDPEETLAILLDHGITTIRALPFHSESALMWAADVHAGLLVGPTLIPTSSIFEKQPQRTMRGFGDATLAERWVRREALLGTRWIKVYNSMDRDCLFAIVETARE